MCEKCHCLIIRQPDLAHLLETLAGALTKTFDPDMRLASVMHARPATACPNCKKEMDQGDYCDAGIVGFERCETCNLLLLDADQLGSMTLMWARMDARLDREQALNRERLKELDNFVDRVLLSRAVSGIITNGLLP
jgi:hypothetical protein